MAKNPFVFPSTFSDSQSPRQSSSSSPSLSFDSYSSSSSDPSVNSPFLSSHHQSLSLQLSQTSSSRSCLPSAAFLGSCAAHKILRRPCNDKCYSASYFPPPISSSYPSAPHMLLALSGGVAAGLNENSNINVSGGVSARKRFRTKFSQDQKEIMYQFAERVGWKMQKRDEELIQEFCNEVGVDKGVLKVWMHNNKNTFGKRDANGNGNGNGTSNNLENNSSNNNNSSENLNHHQQQQQEQHFGNDNVAHVGTNGSSSSS